MKEMLVYVPYIIIVTLIIGAIFIYTFNIIIGLIISLIFSLFLTTLLVAIESIL